MVGRGLFKDFEKTVLNTMLASLDSCMILEKC